MAAVRARLTLPRSVVVLGLVSFLNDAASEMITPLLPLFLTMTLGAGPMIVGLIEGVAEATASLLKLISGRLADRGVPPKWLLLGGYGISNIARPLVGLALSWSWVLGLRFFDRVGKGVRTSPRDALIAAASGEGRRGHAFGFHRAMDNAGAVVGPLLAFALLSLSVPLGHVFLASVVPGVLVLALLVLGLPGRPPSSPKPETIPLPHLRWAQLDARLKGLLLAAGGLALATVPEVFLVLWARSRGLEIVWVPLIWAAASLVKSVLSWPAGALSDRVGRVPVVLVGWLSRVVLLLALAHAGSAAPTIWGLFLAYAGALALTEGAERALIGDYAPARLKGTAFGLYHLITGALTLPGALLFGAVWQEVGERFAFYLAACLTAVAAAGMLAVLRRG